MSKSLTKIVELTIIFIMIAVLVSIQNYRLDIVNKDLSIQARKTDAVICQFNALRKHQINFVDEIQSTENDIVMLEEAMNYIVIIKHINNIISTKGAGFIFDSAKGYIITAYHIIDNDKPDKKMGQASEFKVEINGVDIAVIDMYGDTENDFAILIVDINDVNYCSAGQLNIADIDAKVGETVFAIGHPFNLINTVSKGVVSRTGKSKQFKDYHTNSKVIPIMQFDAAINSGNSGGAVVNRCGNVVGLTTSIWETHNRGGNIGVNFAVPVLEMKKCLTRFDKWLADKEFKLQLKEALCK